MTTLTPPPPTERHPADAPGRRPLGSLRKTALVAGVFYLLTFVSIPTLFIYAPVRTPGYVLGPGPDTGVFVGGLLEVIVALAGIGTAITLYPVVKRQNEGFALGFVAARVLEAGLIFIGVISLLSIVALRQDLAGTDPDALVAAGTSLVAVNAGTFLLGQSLIPGLNALLLGTLLYKARLVPRALPVLGLIGAPVHLAAVVATMFGVFAQFSTVPTLAAIPIALWEFSLGVWLVVKGFTPSPLTAGMSTPAASPTSRNAPPDP